MQYGRLEPIKGVSAQEPTAFTKKTIKELLDEELAARAEQGDEGVARATSEPVQPAPEPAATAAEPVAPAPAEPALQSPPHMRNAAFMPLAEPEAPEAEQEKPRGLLRRLIGG